MTDNIFSFNLVDEKWLPCIRAADGTAVTLSLRETLAQAHELYDLAGETPVHTAALYRLLIAILLRVYQPSIYDEDIWADMWHSPTWDMTRLNAYLDEQKPRFDLFGAHPFYQSDSDDSRVRPKPIVSIKYGNGFLHNPLFDHDNEADSQPLTPAEAARHLITVQTFGLGGGHKGMFTDAPWSKGILFFVQGRMLKETLFLNLLPYPDPDRNIIKDDTKLDAPFWEQADPFAGKGNQPLGYLDYLTWPNRRILLFPSHTPTGEVVVAEWQVGGGLALDSNLQDPFKFYFAYEKTGLSVRQFEESRGLWPNSYALFAPMDLGNKRYSHPPATFNHLHNLIERQDFLPAHTIYRCKALGQGKDQAKVEYLREERFPFPLRYLVEEPLRDSLRDALQMADGIAYDLLGALRRVGFYLYLANSDEQGWKSAGINPKATKQIGDVSKDIAKWVTHTEAELYYWARLELQFHTFIEALAQASQPDPVLQEWHKQIRQAARQAFAQAKQYANESARALHATTQGQSYLEWRLNEKLGKEKKDE